MTTDTNNEVARLRELLNRAIRIAEKLEKEGLSASQLAPEEPVVKESLTTEPVPEWEAEAARLKEQLESTQNLCFKFWSVLEEHGFELEINQ